MKTPPELSERLQEATKLFSRAATNQHDVAAAAESANKSIALALTVSEQLVRAFSEQTIGSRQRQTPIASLMGVSLGPAAPPVAVKRQLVDACNIVQLPVGWRAIESREGKRDWKPTDEQLGWCQTAGLKVAAGPLLRLDDRGVPDWMYLWEGDDDNLVRLLLDHVRAVVSRYAGPRPPVACRVAGEQRATAVAERREPAESRRPSGAGGAEDRSADADRRVVRSAVGRVSGRPGARPGAAPLRRRAVAGRSGDLGLWAGDQRRLLAARQQPSADVRIWQADRPCGASWACR